MSKGARRGGGTPGSLARATPAKSPEEVDEIVRDISVRMSRFEWHSPTSHYELMDKHGVSLDCVKDWSKQASRMLRIIAGDDPEELRANIVTAIEHGTRVALGKTRQFATVKGDVVEYSDPDVNAHLKGLDLKAKLLGLSVERHEHNVNLTEMTEEQLLEELRKAGFEITKKEKDDGGTES